MKKLKLLSLAAISMLSVVGLTTIKTVETNAAVQWLNNGRHRWSYGTGWNHVWSCNTNYMPDIGGWTRSSAYTPSPEGRNTNTERSTNWTYGKEECANRYGGGTREAFYNWGNSGSNQPAKWEWFWGRVPH